MLWLIGLLVAFTVLSFIAAIIASQIMAVVHGTTTQSELELEVKQSWYRPESWLGYHPMNQRVWDAMARHPALPGEVRGKQRTLRGIVVLQTVVVLTAMAFILVTAFLR